MKLYATVVTLSAKDNQKLSKLLSKGFERSVYRNEYRTKSENKNTKNKNRYFFESIFVGIDRFFVLVYSNEDVVSKRFKDKRCYLLKWIIDNYNVTINEKNYQATDSGIKQYEEIRKLTTERGEVYTTGCLLDQKLYQKSL